MDVVKRSMIGALLISYERISELEHNPTRTTSENKTLADHQKIVSQLEPALRQMGIDLDKLKSTGSYDSD